MSTNVYYFDYINFMDSRKVTSTDGMLHIAFSAFDLNTTNQFLVRCVRYNYICFNDKYEFSVLVSSMLIQKSYCQVLISNLCTGFLHQNARNI